MTMMMMMTIIFLRESDRDTDVRTYLQWAAVMTQSGATMLHPQVRDPRRLRIAHCHGHEFGFDTLPLMMRAVVNERFPQGWSAPAGTAISQKPNPRSAYVRILSVNLAG